MPVPRHLVDSHHFGDRVDIAIVLVQRRGLTGLALAMLPADQCDGGLHLALL